MKRNRGRALAALLALLMVLVLLPVTAQAEEVLEIADYMQLKSFALRVNTGERSLCAKLTEDIICTDQIWVPIGSYGNNYTGTFDGQGHTITGLSNASVPYSGFSEYDGVYIGLFAGIDNVGVVRNTAVIDCNLSISSDVEHLQICIGAIAGAIAGTIENCYNTGTVHAEAASTCVGGIVGANYGKVKNCYNTGAVSGGKAAYVGGVVGYTNQTIENCYNTGAVSGAENTTIGGVVGYTNGSIQNCYSTGSVTGGDNANVGGVAGKNCNIVGGCYNTGTVFGGEDTKVGGICGYSDKTVQNCLNIGKVSATGGQYLHYGGICGDNSGTVQNCCNTGEVTSERGGLAGGIAGENTGTVKTCLNAGTLFRGIYIGGIAGSLNSGTVENCLNVGKVSYGFSVGGIVGYNEYGTIRTCLNIGEVSEVSSLGGLGAVVGNCWENYEIETVIENCYYLDTSAPRAISDAGSAIVTNVYALTADELKSLGSCIGFSTEFWEEGFFYPVLKDYFATIRLYAYNGGDAMEERIVCAYAPTKNENPFSYTGYTFTGWNTKANGTGIPYSQKDAVTLLPGDVLTLFAQWKRIVYTVVFNEEDVLFKGTTPYLIADGTERTPRFTVKDEYNHVVPEENCSVRYAENKEAGTAYIFVTLKDGYAGSAEGFFKIYLPASESLSVKNVESGIRLRWAPVEGAAGYVIYRRAWGSTTKGGWTAFDRWNNTTETEWTDTDVYAGTRYQYGVKAYFAKRIDGVSGAEIGGKDNTLLGNWNLGIVSPLATNVRITTRTLSDVTAGTKSMTVKWTGSQYCTGYQIKYATDEDFTRGVRSLKIADPAIYETVIENLRSNTSYYVTVRSYSVFEGMTYFGEWSNVLSCTVN